jgi:transcription antitermination factor NusG
MAKKHWYVLRVRAGFEAVVAQKLRQLNLEVVVPGQKESINSQEPHLREYRSTGYVYCRFALENRLSVTSIPGVVAILGTPEPKPFDDGLVSLTTTTRF